MSRLLFLLPVLAGCPVDTMCTEIGCSGSLELEISGPASLVDLAGTVTVDGHAYAVDCAGTSDMEVACSDTGITITIPGDAGGGAVQWSLTTPAEDTAGAGYAADGEETPTWTEDTPNGPDCPPVCRTATVVVELVAVE